MSSSELEALLAEPALQAPAGATPNYANPPNHNGLAWFVTILCIAVGTICLLLRAYARMWKPRQVRTMEGKILNLRPPPSSSLASGALLTNEYL